MPAPSDPSKYEMWINTTLAKGWGWNKGKPCPKEVREKISKANKGRRLKPFPLTKEEEKEICKLYIEGQSAISLAHEFSCSKSTIKRVLQKQGITRSIEENRQIAFLKVQKLNTDPEILKKRIKALAIRPTKPERKMIDLIKTYNLPFTYTGDGKVILMGLCPDFMDNDGSKRIIEVFGKYWHTGKIHYNRTPQGRREVFSKLDFKTLIIWDDEVDNEEFVLEKIGRF